MAIPSPEQILEYRAAVDTTNPETMYQLLVNQQADHFVILTVPMAIMVRDAKKQRINGPGYVISTMDGGEGQMVGGLSEMETVPFSQQWIPTYGGRLIEPKAFDLSYQYSRREDQMSIEGAKHEQTVDEVVRNVLANEFERIGLMSDTGGVNPTGYGAGNMTTIDGWWVMANEGHVYDHAGGYISPEVFKQLYLHMPYKWRNQPARRADMRFYINDAVTIHYRDVLSKAVTPLGSLSLTENNQIQYAGINLTDNAYMPVDMAGTVSQSAVTNTQFTGALLVETQNLIFGYGPQMKVWSAPDPVSGKFIYYYWVGYIDVQYERIDAVAKGINVLAASDPTLPVFM